MAFDVSGVLDGDQITVIGAYDNKNVGSNKTISFEIIGDPPETGNNYYIDNVTEGVITPRTLIPVTPEGGWTKVYDGTRAYPPAGSTQELVFVEGFDIIPGDQVNVVTAYNSKNVSEANTIIFTLSGSDMGNYIIENITHGEVDVYISKLERYLEWTNFNLEYNGQERHVNATFVLVGEDTGIYGGQYYQMTIKYYADPEHTQELPSYRNAGTYYTVASLHPEDQDYINSNYIIYDTERICVIGVLQRNVVWTGISDYTYTNQNYALNITAEVTLVGTDIPDGSMGNIYLTIIYIRNGEQSQEMRNAGNYQLYAVFPEECDFASNYDLINDTQNVIVNKADINNIKFANNEGFDEYTDFTYVDGAPHYFYVTDKNDEHNYSLTRLAMMYEYDHETEITIVYNGGDINRGDVLGNNGAKNAGSYIIYAIVEATENYNGWQGQVHVNIAKGDPANFIFFNSYQTDYSSYYQDIFVKQ